MSDDSLDTSGIRLAGIEILEKIGEGGMGAVYKARQISLDRIVAVKILPPRLAQDAMFVRQFQAESRVAARLKHPHLIEVYEAGEVGGQYFFVMEYVPGETVGAKLHRDGPFPELVAIGICLHVAEALQYAWDTAKIIHGDIKPENFILERDTKKVRIADLGLGKSLIGHSEEDAQVAESTHGMGTPAYVSPEQARGEKKIDFCADMYALGATLYHMLTGRLPFDGLSPAEILAKHLHGVLPDPRTIRPAISESAVIVLERMMAKASGQRYPSWAVLAHDLAQVQKGQMPSVPPLDEGQSTIQRRPRHAAPPPPKKTSPLRIALELAAIALVLAGVWYYRYEWRPMRDRAASHPSMAPVPTAPAVRGWSPASSAPAPSRPVHPPSALENGNQLAAKEAADRAAEDQRQRNLAAQHAREAQDLARARTEAEQHYAAWMPSFEALLTAGDYARARDAAESAGRDPEFAPVQNALARDAGIAGMILDLRRAALTNLVGQTYFVGSTPGTVVRIEPEKCWVKLSSGEIAVPLDKLDPSKLPTLALSKNRNDPQLNLAAALYCWYRGEKDLAKAYFDSATRAGVDIAPYLPAELAAPPSSPASTGNEPARTTATNAPERAVPSASGDNLLANPDFELWSGKTLLGWSSSGSAVPPELSRPEGGGGVRFACGGTPSIIVLEQPFQALAGRHYYLRFSYRTENLGGKLWAEVGIPGDPVPSVKQPLADSPDVELVTVQFEVPSAEMLKVRIRGTGVTGTVWLDHFNLRY